MPDKILDQYITATLLGSGHAAVHRVLVLEEGETQAYWDMEQTGIGRYEKVENAIIEAKEWAESEGIRYQE